MNFFKKTESKPSRFGPWVLALGLTLSIALGFVGLSWIIEGTTLARRTATSLAMPMGAIWLASVLFGLLHSFRGQFSAAIGFGFLSLLIFTFGNPYLSSCLMDRIQWPMVESIASTETPLRTVVALGGGVSISPGGIPEIGNDGERIFSSAQLWHAGLTQSIICTGATPDGVDNPSDVGKTLLLSAGVPESAIFTVGGETTTGEMNALEEFFETPPEGFPETGDIALCTSAFHMRRAMRLAEQREFDFKPYPCAFRGAKFDWLTPHRWVPVAGAALNIGLALKEELGMLMGR